MSTQRKKNKDKHAWKSLNREKKHVEKTYLSIHYL